MNTLTVNVDAIPESLKTLSQWVDWRYEVDPNDPGKPRKVPRCARTGRKASTTDPATWSSFADALKSFQKHRYDGIGFVFAPSGGLLGVDLDDCIGPDGSISDEAWTIIRQFDSYSEVSPSGKGVKIFAEGSFVGRGKKVGDIEIYQEGRYFTVTGQRLEECQAVVRDCGGAAQQLRDRLEEQSTGGRSKKASDSSNASSSLAMVIDRARKYIDKIDPAISGQNGSDKTYHVAMILIEGFNLTFDQARPLMQEYSTRCLPPWSAKEIDHKLEDAEKNANPLERGRLLRSESSHQRVDGDKTSGNGGNCGVSSTGLSAYRPFPVDLLTSDLATYVRAVAAAIPCDAAMIALPVLAMLAGIIGATRRCCPKKGWYEPAVLWTAIVAHSGGCKTPALEAALKPLRRIERKAWQAHESAMKDFKHRCEDRKRQSKSEKGNSLEAPLAKRYVVGDATIESLASLLRDNPRGLLLERDELAGWIKSMNQYKKGGSGDDQTKWLEMYGAKALRVDRKSGDERFIYVPHAAVSVAGGIQPGTLRRVIGQAEKENGFLARILMASPPERAKRWTEDELPDSTWQPVSSVLERLLTLDFESDQDGDKIPVDIHLDQAARQRIAKFVTEHGAAALEFVSDDLRAAHAKLEGVAIRFALILHLAEWAEGGQSFPGLISLDMIERGIGLARWFGAEAERIYGNLGESPDQKQMRLTLETVVKLGGKVTVRDFVRGAGRRYSGDGAAERAERDLNTLVANELGSWEDRPSDEKGGRPTRYFVLTVDTTAPNTPNWDDLSASTSEEGPSESLDDCEVTVDENPF